MRILKANPTTILSRITGIFDIPGLMQLYKLPFSILKEKPFNPRIPAVFSNRDDIFSILDKQDVMLHHPFESFYPVIELLQSAAHHPDVIAIKQTLYRTSGDSPIVDALIEAANRGKQVTAIIELKARFDEKNNIQWARQLERSGVNVVFGFIGLKTHAKATLIIRKKGRKLVRYSHLSTGNYNSSTAKLYTDIGYMTSDKTIGDDLSKMFNLLTGFNIFQGSIRELDESSLPTFQKIILAPVNMRNHTLRLIKDEINFHKKSGDGHIIAKMNALVDPPIIQALYEASQAGVKIELLVRGVCCLRPGIKGLSENIQVRSILDRFLEHSRVFYFHHDGEQLCYLASADWMTRNMIRRIECMFPIEDPDMKSRLLNEILAGGLEDNCHAWVLDAMGTYTRLQAPDAKRYRSQTEFIETARSEGVKSLPYDEAIRTKSKAGRRRPLIRVPKAKTK
jgi:polyphosphate kinase